jgi:hypothetical protein
MSLLQWDEATDLNAKISLPRHGHHSVVGYLSPERGLT